MGSDCISSSSLLIFLLLITKYMIKSERTADVPIETFSVNQTFELFYSLFQKLELTK